MRSVTNTDDPRPDSREETPDSDHLDLERINAEVEDYQSSPPIYQITTYPADFTLEGLHRKWNNSEILIPDFQREFVWTRVQASRLIESFLCGLPVPAIFLYIEKDTQKYFVLDGQQRLKSVFHYFDGRFPAARISETPTDKGSENAGSVFRLKGLSPESDFRRRTFEELPEREQRRLRNAVLRAFIVQQLEPDDDTSIYHIFERLNTGGTLLANQEIRNCIYRGRFVSFLQDLNRFECWRAILGKDATDRRGRDVELLVRFFATLDLDSYRTPMKRFLSRYMRKNRNPTEETLTENRDLFEKTCRAITDRLGERPFHIRSGLNVAVMDAVMVAFSRNLARIPVDIEARYRYLIKSDAFARNTTERTTDAEPLRQRFRQASEILFHE